MTVLWAKDISSTIPWYGHGVRSDSRIQIKCLLIFYLWSLLPLLWCSHAIIVSQIGRHDCECCCLKINCKANFSFFSPSYVVVLCTLPSLFLTRQMQLYFPLMQRLWGAANFGEDPYNLQSILNIMTHCWLSFSSIAHQLTSSEKI